MKEEQEYETRLVKEFLLLRLYIKDCTPLLRGIERKLRTNERL